MVKKQTCYIYPPGYCPPPQTGCCPPAVSSLSCCPPPATTSCCPPAPCGPFATAGCQGWTGPKGDGILTNTNGAIGVGTGAAVPVASLKGAIAIGPFSGSAGQSANAIALGYFSASAVPQPANSFWSNTTGASIATVYLAGSVVFRTQSVISNPTAGGFYCDSVKDVNITANMHYNPVTAEISFDSTI